MHTVQLIEKKLREPIDKGRIRKRQGPGGNDVEYLNDGDVAVALNEAFGTCGWDATVTKVDVLKCGRVDALGVYLDDPTQGTAWDAVVYATVEVAVYAEHKGQIIIRRRSDVGGSGGPRGSGNKPNAKSLSEAVEFAVKSAVTDAFKRAARLFGPKTGLLLRFKGGKERDTIQAALDAQDQLAEAELAEIESSSDTAAIEMSHDTVAADVETGAAAEIEVSLEEDPVAVAVEDAPTEVETQPTEESPTTEEPTQEVAESTEATESAMEESVVEPVVEEAPAEEAVAEPAAEEPVAEEPVAEAPVEAAESTEVDGPVAVPAIFAELPGAAEALERICALQNKTDAVEVADLGSVHNGLVETFGEAATFALWSYVGVDLSVKPILVSRDQVLTIAQALEEASLSEGGIEGFLTSISVQPAEDETGAPPIPSSPAGETHGEQVAAAWAEWIPVKVGSGHQNVVDALMTEPEESFLAPVLTNQLNQVGMRRLKQKDMPPARAMEMWKEAGFTFNGKSRPTIAQARKFVQLLPDV